MAMVNRTFLVGPVPGELKPAQVIDLFRSSIVDDWVQGDEDDEAGYSHRRNLLVTLSKREDGRFDLRFGYQTVAIVDGPGAPEVLALPLELKRVG